MITLAPAEADFLRSARVARLATASADGKPHVVPVCFAFDGMQVFTAIDAKQKRVPSGKLRRLQNLRENPRVSLVVDHYEEDWRQLRYILVAGRGEILEAGTAWQQAWDLLQEKYSQYLAMPVPGRGPVVQILPERVVVWQAGRAWGK